MRVPNKYLWEGRKEGREEERRRRKGWEGRGEGITLMSKSGEAKSLYVTFYEYGIPKLLCEQPLEADKGCRRVGEQRLMGEHSQPEPGEISSFQRRKRKEKTAALVVAD